MNTLLESGELPNHPPSSDEKTMALLAHLITIVSSFIGPLIIFLIKKDDSKFVSDHAKESLNFQITVAIISFVLIISIIGILLLWLVGIVVLILVIIATVKAAEGEVYRYPFSLRLIK